MLAASITTREYSKIYVYAKSVAVDVWHMRYTYHAPHDVRERATTISCLDDSAFEVSVVNTLPFLAKATLDREVNRRETELVP